ncbi:MAG: hypothetical protein LBJ64_11660 [Deltaproteobacteria bacterium]|jgi:hypothetical protein|nr:hypothetical protein [Deltaproteobacteria bacterium]
MTRTLFAQTNEVDEPDLAMIELIAQLELDNNLQKNAIGLIFGDFAQTAPGFLTALNERLPFDVVGVSAALSISPKIMEDYCLLTLVVLTSDECQFVTGLSEDIDEHGVECLEDLYGQLAGGLGDPPSLVLCYAAKLTTAFGGDRVVNKLNDLTGAVPIFGSIACAFDSLISNSILFYNGQFYTDRVALIMIEGPIRPKFSFFQIPENKILKRKAIVTSSSGNVVKRINGMPALDYLKTIGLFMNSHSEYADNIPLIVEDHQLGWWYPVMIMALADDAIICTHDVRENNTLGIGGCDDGYVLKSASQLAEELKWEHFDFCLIHSCQGRHISLGLDYLGEIEILRTELGGHQPFSLSYSGGEFCPRPSGDGYLNAFHCLSLCCCRF